MKINHKILFVSLFLLSTVTSFATPKDKDYKKIIEKHDVAEAAKSVPENSPLEFWQAVINYDGPCNKFISQMKKKRGAEKEAIKKTDLLPHLYTQYDERVVSELQPYCDSILVAMGIPQLGVKCTLHVIDSDEINTFTALTDDGFSICLTSALLNKKGVNDNVVKGYVAHEFAHGAMLHHVRQFYSQAKKTRRKNLIEGIAVGTVGIFGIAALLDPTPDPYYGNYPYVDNDININVNSNNKIIKPDLSTTLKYSFPYTQDFEYEADLFAYRFMQNLGCEDEYTNGLKILGGEYDQLYNNHKDYGFGNHISIPARIDFLNYVKENPQFGNTNNATYRLHAGNNVINWYN